VAEVVPFTTQLYCLSRLTATFPFAHKAVFITQIVKKSGLNSAAVKSYRQISYLPVVSKLHERLVAQQVVNQLQFKDLIHYQTFLSGGFPSSSLTAIVTSVPKTMFPILNHSRNFRPIPVTPILQRLAERLWVRDWLRPALADVDLLD
jgi:hypothetical protein